MLEVKPSGRFALHSKVNSLVSHDMPPSNVLVDIDSWRSLCNTAQENIEFTVKPAVSI